MNLYANLDLPVPWECTGISLTRSGDGILRLRKRPVRDGEKPQHVLAIIEQAATNPPSRETARQRAMKAIREVGGS